MVAQVLLFSPIGLLLGTQWHVHHLLVGNAVMVVATTWIVVPSTTWERRLGTMSLLVAAPGGQLAVYAGRSAKWLPDALASSIGQAVALEAFIGAVWLIVAAVAFKRLGQAGRGDGCIEFAE